MLRSEQVLMKEALAARARFDLGAGWAVRIADGVFSLDHGKHVMITAVYDREGDVNSWLARLCWERPQETFLGHGETPMVALKEATDVAAMSLDKIQRLVDSGEEALPPKQVWGPRT